MLPLGIELMLPCAWPLPNRSNSLGFWTGRGQQDPVKEREDGGVGADAQRQGEDGDKGEAGCGRCFPFNASGLRAISYLRNAQK